VRDDAAHGAGEPAAQGSVGNHRKGTAKTRDVPGFRGRHQGDAAPGQVGVEHRQRQVLPVFIEQQAAVDFVGADDEIMALAESDDLL
jgi:hypothetical protein